METIVLDTLEKLHRHARGLFGWCSDCGSLSRYREDVKARRTPTRTMFDIDLPALIRERGEQCAAVELEAVKTETRVTTPARVAKAHHL
jgi:hypothetical protein